MYELREHPRLFRCGRSYVVNLDHVETFEKTDGGYITRQGGEQITLARDLRAGFGERLSGKGRGQCIGAVAATAQTVCGNAAAQRIVELEALHEDWRSGWHHSHFPGSQTHLPGNCMNYTGVDARFS